MTDFDKVIAMFVRTGVWSRMRGQSLACSVAALPMSSSQMQHRRKKGRVALHQNCILFPIFGTLPVAANCELGWGGHKEKSMNGLIYLVGLIVVILAILSFFGLR